MTKSNDKIVFLTPQQVLDMGIKLTPGTDFYPDEINDVFPMVLDSLKDIVRQTYLGNSENPEATIEVENSRCKAYTGIVINGKFCKLQAEELTTPVGGVISVNEQARIFQRLISEGQIALEDLAVEDIDNSVYKQLVINELNGVELCKNLIKQLDDVWENQQKDEKLVKRAQLVLNTI